MSIQSMSARQVFTEILCLNILEYIDTHTLLSWSCTCRLSQKTTHANLLQVFQQLQKDCRILLKILQNRYLREALNLTQSEMKDPGLCLDLYDLDIVLMRAGGVDETDETERLSIVEEQRLTLIGSVDFDTKKNFAETFLALGYAVEISPMGEDEIDTPMEVSGRMISYYTCRQALMHMSFREFSNSDDQEAADFKSTDDDWTLLGIYLG